MLDAASPPADLAPWLSQQGCKPETLVALSGDVSPRRYYRLDREDGGTAILATYPAELREVLRRFAASTALLAAAGVRVPAILACDEARGLMLQEDLGRDTLYDWRERSWSVLAAPFATAIALARRIAALSRESVVGLGSPPLDTALLTRELEQTFARLLLPHGLISVSGDEEELRAVFAELCARLGGAELVPCHRDFMARNLMPLGAGELAVVDHQDLRLGPPWYDLASLCNDSLFPPLELARRWFAAAAWSPAPEVDYHRAAAQRGFKAAGTFAAFAARGEPRHLPLIAPTLRRALEHLAATREGSTLARQLAKRWRERLASPFC